jgi:hypothetical protein
VITRKLNSAQDIFSIPVVGSFYLESKHHEVVVLAFSVLCLPYLPFQMFRIASDLRHRPFVVPAGLKEEFPDGNQVRYKG